MKGKLLETTRLLLALERAADLGEAGITVESLAQDFKLSEKSLRQALETLDGLGQAQASPDELFDLEWCDDGRLIVHFLPGLDEPVPLLREELVVLLMGLDLLGLPVDKARSLQGRLLSRLDSSTASRLLELRQRLDVAADHPQLTALTEAVDRGLSLEILYDTGRGELWRPIRPSALVSFEGRSYVGGYCGLRAAARVFRVDRILDSKPTENLAAPEDHLPTAESLRTRVARMHHADRRQLVVLRAQDRFGEWALEDRYGRHARDDQGQYSTLVHPGHALAAWIVSQAGSVEVVEPPELRDGVARRAQALLEAHHA